MSSTELDAELRRLADPLFDALTAAASGAAPFPLGPDPALASYYTQRSQLAMRRQDFLAASVMDAAEFGERLAGHWRRAGHPELAGLAPQVAAAARDMHALTMSARPRAELSPYIYQMF